MDLVPSDYAIKVEIITRQLLKHRAPDSVRPRLVLNASVGSADGAVHVDIGAAELLARVIHEYP